MRYNVLTESGTKYIIDDKAREVVRRPHPDANPLSRDYEVLHYVAISPLPCEFRVGDVIFFTTDDDYWMRSTPIISVRELHDDDL